MLHYDVFNRFMVHPKINTFLETSVVYVEKWVHSLKRKWPVLPMKPGEKHGKSLLGLWTLVCFWFFVLLQVILVVSTFGVIAKSLIPRWPVEPKPILVLLGEFSYPLYHACVHDRVRVRVGVLLSRFCLQQMVEKLVVSFVITDALSVNGTATRFRFVCPPQEITL